MFPYRHVPHAGDVYKRQPYEEFIDNESLEKLVRELNAGGAHVAPGYL